MAVSASNLAKRAFVTLLLALARQYAIPALPITRDSPDKAVLDAFRKVARKVHPDKGGSKSDAQKFNAAQEAWDKAVQDTRPARQDHTRPGQNKENLTKSSESFVFESKEGHP